MDPHQWVSRYQDIIEKRCSGFTNHPQYDFPATMQFLKHYIPLAPCWFNKELCIPCTLLKIMAFPIFGENSLTNFLYNVEFKRGGTEKVVFANLHILGYLYRVLFGESPDPLECVYQSLNKDHTNYADRIDLLLRFIRLLSKAKYYGTDGLNNQEIECITNMLENADKFKKEYSKILDFPGPLIQIIDEYLW
jgi:hypothetical protein